MEKFIKNTVDAVIYRKNKNREYEILLVQRKKPPFEGKFALPGGFVEYGESVEEACIREVKEETNLNVKIERLIGVYSKPDRDPRGHTITVAFLCALSKDSCLLAGDDVKNAKFFIISEILNMQLAFDHKCIIEDALRFLENDKRSKI